MKRGSSFRERWRGSGKNVVKLGIRIVFEWLILRLIFLEINGEPIALNRSQSSQDAPNDDADDAFKPSTLRRSFRRMRKAVK